MTTSTPSHSTASTPLRLLVVAGGTGSIGSHMVKHLLRRGCEVVTFDNLSTGHRDAVLGNLNWQPTRFDLESIIEDAWKWEEKTALQPIQA